MKYNMRFVNWLLRKVFEVVSRVSSDEFKQIPCSGPLILVGNHVNFLETPLVLAQLDNPSVTGLAKRESWNNPLFNFLFTRWGLIPIDRGTVDRDAMRMCIEALDQGKMVAISPEGTRSKDGQLLPGKPGIVPLAIQSGAPLLPVGFYGHEHFWANLKSLRKTEFHVSVGKPFRLIPDADVRSRDVRQAITDEIMYKIAELLPEKYRGHYRYEDKVVYQHLIPDNSPIHAC